MDRARKERISTPHGELAVTTLGTGSPALLLLHSNSGSSKMFRHIFDSDLARRHRLVAFDLPGHGDSGDAPDAPSSYTQPAYAQAAVSVLRHLGVGAVVVFGWSMGGHVGMEMVPLLAAGGGGGEMRGLLISGAPPVEPGAEVLAGFVPRMDEIGAAREVLTVEQMEHYVRAGVGREAAEPWMLHDVARTDGRAREIMWRAWLKGRGSDQMRIVEESEVLLAVVNGAADPFVDLEFVRGIRYRNLWRGRCIEMQGLGHAPFLERPDDFQLILESFMRDVSAECEKGTRVGLSPATFGDDLGE